MAEDDKEQPIIIKKIKKGGGGHHGGAWKVAYADFVTAMMAFFLLLWLLNVTTEEQKNAIANYFDPTHPKVSLSESGAGGVMGGLTMSPQGAMTSTKQDISPPPANSQPVSRGNVVQAKDVAKEILKQEEEKRFKEASDRIKQAIQDDPELAELANNLIVDMTPEGLRVQIVDDKGQAMFASGSARMFNKTRDLLQKVSGVIGKTTENQLSIRGHTDSVPYGVDAEYTNWELSTDRANASRRVMLENGFPAERINNVIGKADTEHLVPDDPTDPRNRRITIILLKEELTNPEYDQKVEETVESLGYASPSDEVSPSQEEEAFQKTSGQVEFP